MMSENRRALMNDLRDLFRDHVRLARRAKKLGVSISGVDVHAVPPAVLREFASEYGASVWRFPATADRVRGWITALLLVMVDGEQHPVSLFADEDEMSEHGMDELAGVRAREGAGDE